MLLLLFMMIGLSVENITAANVQTTNIPKMMQASSSVIKFAGKNNPQVVLFADTLARGSQVAQNAVDFTGSLPAIEKQAQLLEQRVRCLTKAGSTTCSTLDIGCATEEACIVNMLAALTNLLEPLMKHLLGQGVTVGKTTHITPGAVYNLVQLMPDGAKRTEYQNRLIDFISSISDDIAFIRAITYMIDPSLVDKDPTMSAALKASYKSEPIVIEATPQTFEDELKEFA